MKTHHSLLTLFAALALWAGHPGVARAQWVTQTFTLKPGWNAIYLHVDTSHATLTELIDSDPANSLPISEVWLWAAPASMQQFVENPQQPIESGSQWVSWVKSLGASSNLQRLGGNVACLVRMTNTVDFVWQVKGKPVPPEYSWTTTGLNFMGFPTPEIDPPWWETFLAKAPSLRMNAEIYHYPGGELGEGNPARLFALLSPLQRGRAVWIRTGTTFNRYFGPFDIELQDAAGVHFRDTMGQYRVRLRNTTSEQITVTLNLLPSEAAPEGQVPVAGAMPLLLRGELSLADLTHGHEDLSEGPQSWTLAPRGQPGSEVEAILGLDRSAMGGVTGDLHAGILRFTDHLGLSQIDIPASAEVASTVGLWVGAAVVGYVSHYLKNFAHITVGSELPPLLDRLSLAQGVDGDFVWDESTGRVLVFGGPENKTGSYLLDGPIKVDSGAVSRPFPLRLIIHNDGETCHLLQRVYLGFGAGTNAVVTTRESALLPSHLETARRISSIHLPFSAGNVPWPFTGTMAQGENLTTMVGLSYDDQASNPFLHSYHPDHDNLDPLFETQQPQGVESYGVTRSITLTFTTPDDDFNSLTSANQTLTGHYVEVITFLGRGGHEKEFHTLGSFALNRISNHATLTTTP